MHFIDFFVMMTSREKKRLGLVFLVQLKRDLELAHKNCVGGNSYCYETLQCNEAFKVSPSTSS